MTNQWTSWWSLIGILACCGSAACGTHGNQTGYTPTPGDTAGSNAGGASNAGSGAASGGGGSQIGGSGASGGGASAGGAASGTVVASGASGSATGSGSGGGGESDSSEGGEDAGALPPPTPHMGNTCLKAGSGDYSKPGPYQVALKTNVDLSSLLGMSNTSSSPTTYTIFYPQPFEPNCPSPVVAWGNGTAVTGHAVYAFFNNAAASYGIVVIASDNPDVGSGKYHKAGIDYMMAQNADSSSIFYNKLNTRVGVSGHSQGAIGATLATTLIGVNCEAEVCVAGGGAPLKSTAFLCLTGTKDLLESACKETFPIAGPPSFLADWDGGDHVTTETLAGYIVGNEGSIQMMNLYAAWFRCFLADDQVACKMFEGGAPGNCGMCKDPGWASLESRGL
jgi:hypothetical protein